MFKVLIVPSYSLMKGINFWLSNTDKELVTKHYGQMFKIFMGLPKSTPREVIKVLAGDVEQSFRVSSLNSDTKNTNRESGGG